MKVFCPVDEIDVLYDDACHNAAFDEGVRWSGVIHELTGMHTYMSLSMFPYRNETAANYEEGNFYQLFIYTLAFIFVFFCLSEKNLEP